MFKRKRPIAALYAAPRVFEKDDEAPEKPEYPAPQTDEEPKAEYPDSLAEEEQPVASVYAGPGRIKKRPRMGRVYAGPEPDKRNEELFSGVYAGPEMMDGRPPFGLVYAGPDWFANKNNNAGFQDVYAGPAPEEPEDDDKPITAPEIPPGACGIVQASPDLLSRFRKKPDEGPLRTCPSCGAKVPESFKFCAECGTPFPEEPHCPECGAKTEEGQKFCHECGRKLQ